MPAAPPHPALTAGHVFIAASMDGYVARRDGGIDWLDPYTEDHGYDAFMAGVDGLIMRRATFELVPFTKPIVVLSRSLVPGALPQTLAGKVRILDGTPREVMRDLSEDGWRNAYVDGSKIIQSFLRDGLIADLIVTRVPPDGRVTSRCRAVAGLWAHPESDRAGADPAAAAADRARRVRPWLGARRPRTLGRRS